MPATGHLLNSLAILPLIGLVGAESYALRACNPIGQQIMSQLEAVLTLLHESNSVVEAQQFKY
jgi:fructose-specific phosphotransferase system IIC component